MTSKNLITAIVFINVVVLLYITDPTVIDKLPFRPNATFLSLISIIGYSVLGFIITTVVPDFYMDDEYKSSEQATARAIHTVGLCIIYSTTLFAFLN